MCDCIQQWNEALKDRNTYIETVSTISRDLSTRGVGLLLPTKKIDSKNRKPVAKVLARFCPFCGEAYK